MNRPVPPSPSRPRRPIAVREVPAAEDHTIADVMARAFWDDPVMSWMMPDDRTRYARLSRLFRLEVHSVRERGKALASQDSSGAAMWLPPGRWKTPTATMIRETPAMAHIFGVRIRAAIGLLGMIEKVHPSEPHWYLSAIGTDPARRGTGAGAALITAITDRCDEEGSAAYLESSKFVNVPYYERFGFRVTGEITVPDGPTLWSMWRDPA